MVNDQKKEVWFVTGSQHLYGPEVLEQVDRNSATITKSLNIDAGLAVKIVHRGVVSSPEQINTVCLQANAHQECVGVILWMHTFSPAKMWIKGLKSLQKPICHLHTQFNAEIPWESIDMDFMNLNQSAHGDRELGFMMSRMRKNRKIIVGHWKSHNVHKQLDIWSRAAMGWQEMQGLNVGRIGDNMREVAVTEGNKVSAEMDLGISVNGYDTSDVLQFLPPEDSSKVWQLISEYEDAYTIMDKLKEGGAMRNSLLEAARIEIALETFLNEMGFGAFTDTFENLGRFRQLPGIAVQRLMEKGYGFGAEGDWKTAALLRAVKKMGIGLEGGTSFMEDYTYHFGADRSLVLGAHMLEICPSIAAGRPTCEIHPLGIGGKEDPVRLVFNGKSGPAINVSLIDMGNRFRLIVNEVDAMQPEAPLPNLPVARVLWDPKPELEIAAKAWFMAGGAHHTVYSQAIDTSFMEDFAEMAGIELVIIDRDTKIRALKESLQSSEVYYHLFQNGL